MNKEIKELLDKWVNGTWSVDANSFINVDGHVSTYDFYLYQDQIKFGTVTGNFICSHNIISQH